MSLRVSSSLVLLSGYLALASVRGYPALLVALPLAAIALTPYCEQWDAGNKKYRTLTTALTIIYACFLPFSFYLLGGLNGVVALVMFIQLHTQLHVKGEKGYHYLYLMTFFLVLAACVQSPEPAIALVLLLYLVSLIWGMSSLRVWTERAAAGQEVEPTLIAAGGQRDEEGPAQSARWGYTLSLAASSVVIFALAALFFLSTPRIEAGFLGRDNNVVAFTGLSETVSLNGGAYVSEDPTPVMQVEFPRIENGMFPESQMYWRVSTLTFYEDSEWERRGIQEHYVPGVDPLHAETPDMARHRNPIESEIARERSPLDYPIVEQRIFLSQLPPEGLPALDLPIKFVLEGNTSGKQILWEGRRDMTVRLQKTSSNSIDYTVWSEMVQLDEQLLRAAPSDYAGMDPRDYAMLTSHDLSQETVDLAREVTQDADTLYDKARALEAFLSGPDFEYTLNLPPMPPTGVIDAFVLEIRQGHCEFYASALALMLRSLGVPTRVVSGYRGGEWSAATKSFTVRGSMAHLWTEAYFSGAGWVRLDPAPAILMEPPQGVLGLLQRINDAQLRAQMFWYREVISFDRALQLERLRGLPKGLFSAFGLGDTPEESTTQGRDVYVLSGSVFLGAVSAAVVGTLLLRRRRPGQHLLTADQKRAVRLYRSRQKALQRAGISPQGLTAEELQAEASARGWTQYGEIADLIAQYNAVRFGQRPMEAGHLRALLARLRTLRPGRA